MNHPSLDELLRKVDSRYTLVVVAAKRARILTENGEVGFKGTARKPVTEALQEVSLDRVLYQRTRQGIK